MKKLKKLLGIFGMLVLVIGVMVGCSDSPSDDKSTPEAAMENYMATVKSGDIEKSHEFIHPTVIESYSDNNNDDLVIDDEMQEEIQKTKGYKAYQKELTNIYNNLEYEITDTHEKEGFDQMEFTIDLTMTDIDRINEESIDDIANKYVVEIFSSEDEKDIVEDFDKIYAESAKALKDNKDMKDTVTGFIIFVEDGTEEDEFEREWIIAGMDYELFNKLANKKDI